MISLRCAGTFTKHTQQPTLFKELSMPKKAASKSSCDSKSMKHKDHKDAKKGFVPFKKGEKPAKGKKY